MSPITFLIATILLAEVLTNAPTMTRFVLSRGRLGSRDHLGRERGMAFSWATQRLCTTCNAANPAPSCSACGGYGTVPQGSQRPQHT